MTALKLSNLLRRLFHRRRPGLSQEIINRIRTDIYGLPAETKHPHPSCQTNEGGKSLDPKVIQDIETLIYGLPAAEKVRTDR